MPSEEVWIFLALRRLRECSSFLLQRKNRLIILRMERAELRLPRNPYSVPESSMTISRKMTPETDPIMSEEDLAFSVQRFRTDSRVLVMLAVSHADLQTPAEIKNFYKGFHPEGKEVFSRQAVAKILNEFSTHGILEEIPGKMGRVYVRPSYCDTYIAQAGHLAEFSSQHPVQLGQLFGKAETAGRQTSPLHSPGGYTHDRIRILRKLNEMRRSEGQARIPLAGVQSKIAEELSLQINSVRSHLDALDRAGMLTRGSKPAKGSYQKYVLAKNIPDYKGEEVYPKHSINDWIEEYTQVEFYRTFSTDDAFLYVVQHMEGSEDMSIEELRLLKAKVTQAVYLKRRKGDIRPVTPFGAHSQSYVEFGRQTGQAAALRDCILTLSTMQREETRVEKEGIRKGEKILQDRQLVQKLLQKVEKDSVLHEENRGLETT